MEIFELLPRTSEYEEHQQALEFERMNNEAHWQNLRSKKFVYISESEYSSESDFVDIVSDKSYSDESDCDPLEYNCI